MTVIDRRYSVAEGVAIKAPCRCATTGNIALAGLQTIDTVLVAEHDRVLVWQQTDATQNGIYEVSTGNWQRTKDCDGAYDIVTGTRVYVWSGSQNRLREFAVTTADDPIVIGTSAITWVPREPIVNLTGGGVYLEPEQFGPVGTLNDYETFQAWAQATVTLGLPWRIPPGTYVVDGADVLVLKTSGICEGLIQIPKGNQVCRFDILRDNESGTVLNTAGWFAMPRGGTLINALNAFGKNLFLASTEVLIERDGGASTSYFKQEFVRCRAANGALTTPLVHTYNALANLTVTAHDPSPPIHIRGLRIERTGSGTPPFRGSIVVWRDNVTLDRPSVINDDPSVPLSFGIEVGYCADVVVNAPYVRGCNDVANGLGYGLITTATIGCVINNPDIADCREAISGAYDVDRRVIGGSCAPVVDDHWGDRCVVRDTKITCIQGGAAIQYAGNDLTVENVVQTNGRSLVVIRNDTPQLGGVVKIVNPKIYSTNETGDFYLFSMSSPDGPGAYTGGFAFTNKPTLPDIIDIDGGSLFSDAALRYIAYLGVVEAAHTNWGTVLIRGAWEFDGITIGIFYEKNSAFQEDRPASLVVDGPIDFRGGTAVYATALDAVATRGANIQIRGGATCSARFSPYSAASTYIADVTLADVTNDNTGLAYGSSIVVCRGAVFTGGAVNYADNIAFFNCAFTGVMTNVPDNTHGTYVGCVKAGGSGLPANITNNVVSPFST